MKNPNTKDIPVVVVSADAMSKQIETLMAEGAKAYLTKPLEIKLFLNIVDEFTKE
jgi:CheY-like chemotaxis protein